MLAAGQILQIAGLIMLSLSMVLSVLSAVEYTFHFREALAQHKQGD